ncbi:SPOR domain-containing protein [Polaromonas jejuensis]|uniref:SPOR domain-containing protein n=1 Tax=Polaromonas jejuensis TaxID=457502 RepID=A0ABW0Q5K8_9BURK|nr:SPOR domain-containing protein [Polaromonas jejuensis]
MLRLLVLALVLANAGYFAWTQGLLADYGLAPATQSEPQRLAQQLRPEAMHLLNAGDARQPEGAAPGNAGECLQAGLFSEEQVNALRPRLQSSLPAGSWVLESGLQPGRWIVYMGKYANEEALSKKRGELRQLGVSVEPLVNPALSPGLSLGHYGSQADAEREMARVATHGVRTARVVLERPELRGQTLKLASVDAALRAKLEALKPQLEGKALQACR